MARRKSERDKYRCWLLCLLIILCLQDLSSGFYCFIHSFSCSRELSFCLVMSFISYTPLNRLLHIGLFHFLRLRVTVASRVCSCYILHSKRQAILIHPPVTPVIFPRPYRAENTLKPGLHFPKTPILPLGYQPQPPWLPNHHNDCLVGFVQPFTHG